MMQNNNIASQFSYFFVGIGGIGMSALARYFAQNGYHVFGYDKTPTTLTSHLNQEGLQITFDEDEAMAWLKEVDVFQTKVVYTPAVSTKTNLFRFLLQRQFILIKRAELLGEITKNKFCLAVAGTHGKTTTTAILTHILKDNDLAVTAFLGGILTKENTNYINTGSDVFVVEADEFDRSFMHLHPTAAVITSTDADHLEIYGTHEALLNSFSAFSKQVKGKVFTATNVSMASEKIGFSAVDDIYAYNISVHNGTYVFDVVFQGKQENSVQLSLPGKHNIFNALSAVALATYFRPEMRKNFLASLASFKGVQRRFNYVVQEENLSIIDDYAHHPTEIEAAHQAAREMHPNDRLMVIFQPHLYSRTQKFADEFARSLQLFDEIRLLEIYPAREEPIAGINAKFLAQKIKNKQVKVIEKSEMLEHIKHSSCKIICLLGAGDIGVEAQKIKYHYTNEVE